MMLVATAAALAIAITSGVALGAGGSAKLKGQILVSDEPIPTLDDEAKIGDVLKKWNKVVLEKPKESGAWTFHMMSFPSAKPGVSTLTLLFYDVSNGKKSYLTSKDVSCDPAATILASEVEVSEEDGVKPGMKIEISLAKIIGDRQTDLARAKLTFK
jgi:hypothetical protein